MAKQLNKTRLRDTNLIMVLSFIIIVFSKEIISIDNFEIHESVEFFGYLMVSIAAIGRVYCTAFLGGFKNRKIIDHGPFSVCRNPLYLCSLIGVTGIALITVNIIVIAILPISILLIYIALIKREEEHLAAKFGEPYLTYKAKTPRLLPKFKLYHAPVTVEMTPRTIRNAFRDSLMWLLAFPLVELIEYLQDKNILKPLFIITL